MWRLTGWIDGERIVNTFIGAFVGTMAALLAVWFVAALIIGSVELFERLT